VVGGALLAATFADDGAQPAARIVDAVDGAPEAAEPSHRALPEAVARAVGKMMVATCDVCSAAKSFGRHRKVKVAGKTGTLTTTEPFVMESSWFVGYAPADKPEIVVSVLLGNAENWHLRGHEAARRLIYRAIRRDEDHDDGPSRPTKRVR
jgi:peptidoglycan glycosyltransferase